MKNPHRKRASRYDIGILLQSIIAAIDPDTYPTSNNFRNVVDSVVRCYLRGRNIRLTLTAMIETINEITEYSLKNEDEQTLWWRSWLSRSDSQLRDRQASTDSRPRRLPVRRLPLRLRPETYAITTDVDLLVTGIGQEIAILGDRGRFQIFTAPDEAREFGVGLLSALNKLEMDLGVIAMDPIPFDYADKATMDWEEAVRWSINEGDEEQNGDQTS